MTTETTAAAETTAVEGAAGAGGVAGQAARPHDVVRAFAANPAFRAATAQELTNEHNPYRRPVRPDDLPWLNFGKPLPVHKVLRLSGLLGHRILRNCYDVEEPFLVRPGEPGRRAGRRALLRPAQPGRRRAVRADPGAAPVRHAGGRARAAGRSEPRGTAPAHRLARAEELAAEPGRAFDVALRTRDRQNAATFMLVQLSAMLPAAAGALGRHAAADYDRAHPEARGWLAAQHRAWTARGTAYAALFEQAGLTAAPVAYWQFFLSTSLGRANHLIFLSRYPERYAEFLGAAAYRLLDEAATAARFAEVLGTALGIEPGYFDQMIAPPASADEEAANLAADVLVPLVARDGESALTAFHAGFEDARWLARLWDADLSAQLDWGDQIELYQEKAEKIDAKLKHDAIEVDLDTFVETEEETSTTHVHNEHRLVIIEEGQMHFWNNVGVRIALNKGDKLLIPTSRLHGSVVLSGSCTYHQPIIPDELFAQF
jgi:hypothetical protein